MKERRPGVTEVNIDEWPQLLRHLSDIDLVSKR